jgi:hypothetical protein
MSVEAEDPASSTDTELKNADIKEKAADLRAYKISLKPNANQTARIDALLQEAYKEIGYTSDTIILVNKYKSKQELAAYIAVVKDEMNNIVNPPKDDSKDNKDNNKVDKVIVNKIKKVNSKVMMESKVVIISNNLNHNSKVIQVVEVYKNKKNNHKNRVVVNLGRIHKKKMNQNKMLGMILIVCGNKQ